MNAKVHEFLAGLSIAYVPAAVLVKHGIMPKSAQVAELFVRFDVCELDRLRARKRVRWIGWLDLFVALERAVRLSIKDRHKQGGIGKPKPSPAKSWQSGQVE